MKILNKNQIQAADAYTIEHEPVKSIDLMERASRAFTEAFTARFHPDKPVTVFAGKGNNGGDGLAIARLLLEKGYNVSVCIVHYTDKASVDFEANHQRLQAFPGVAIAHIDDDTPIPEPDAETVVIDALWGSGLSRPIEGFARQVIQRINDSEALVAAVDIPSGVYCDDLNMDEAKVKADYTYTFQCPKLAFFCPENQPYTGKFQVLDIGLDQQFIQEQETPYHFTRQAQAEAILKPRSTFEHKGDFGHALIIAGGYGKVGAAIISSEAGLKVGSGLLTAYIPACGYAPMQTALPEVMVKTDPDDGKITQLPAELDSHQAIGIGPGIGRDKATAEALIKLFNQTRHRLVLDADALNLLSEHNNLWQQLPSGAILTPHPGEFARLIGKRENSMQRLEKLRDLARTINGVVVLKGAFTAVALPDGSVHFNSTGNPGMATAGSGDALTGVLTGLSAQGYEPAEAALLGVYLHGLAGDMAACEKGMEGLMARDLTAHLSAAFKTCYQEPKRLHRTAKR